MVEKKESKTSVSIFQPTLGGSFISSLIISTNSGITAQGLIPAPSAIVVTELIGLKPLGNVKPSESSTAFHLPVGLFSDSRVPNSSMVATPFNSTEMMEELPS